MGVHLTSLTQREKESFLSTGHEGKILRGVGKEIMKQVSTEANTHNGLGK